MKLDNGSRFACFVFEDNEEAMAKAVNPYFLAYLQNKIEVVANSCVNFNYDPSKDLTAQVIQHESFKAQVEILEELLRELQVPEQQPAQDEQP